LQRKEKLSVRFVKLGHLKIALPEPDLQFLLLRTPQQLGYSAASARHGDALQARGPGYGFSSTGDSLDDRLV